MPFSFSVIRQRFLKISAICLVALLCFPAQGWARKAETMLLPTRIVMDNGQRFATLVIKNSGDASGEYTISTVDMKMNEDGSIVEIPEGTTPDFPAAPLVHIAPRSITLPPGTSQTVRILLRKPEGLEPGEYRSHIRVRVVNDNVEDSEDSAKPENARIQVRANLVLVIPLIVRNGQTEFKAGITEAHVVPAADGGQALDFYITREGNRSVMGDVKVTQVQNGAAVQVGELAGVPVYRPTARRLVHVPLSGLHGTSGLTVQYRAQESEGSGVLAESQVR